MSARQTTLAGSFELRGVGVHTGEPSALRVAPAAAGSGFLIAAGGEVIPALAEHVSDTRRATTLGLGARRVSTVEHLLSALFGMGVDNALITVDGPEFPIADGSAAEFADAVAGVGIVELDRPRVYLTLDEPLAVRDGDAIVVALPAPDFSIRVAVDHGPPIGAHTFSGPIDPQTYRAEIAAARTYCSLADAERMRAMGLVRGGSLERALVFGDDGPMTPLRWPGEPARHKALDLIGDLALVGARLRAEVVAFKSGHTTHTRLAAELRRRLRSGAEVPA